VDDKHRLPYYSSSAFVNGGRVALESERFPKFEKSLEREQGSVYEEDLSDILLISGGGVLAICMVYLVFEFMSKSPFVGMAELGALCGFAILTYGLYIRKREHEKYHFRGLSRRIKDGKRLLPIASMVANFQKPTENQPSLLNHSEVVTFFHEFGHLMHAITNKASYARFGLSGVLRDFIEVPSQMLENWAWKEEVLTLLSGHFEDNKKKLPSEMLKRMIKAKLLDIGSFQLRQVFYSLIDLKYHTEGAEDTTAEYIKLFREITRIELPDETTPDAGFGHVMGGYAAAYYSYLWSKVYAEDLFTKFEKAGFMDEKTGLEYREKILAPGGSKDPDEMVRDFLGRKSNNEAFLRSLGFGKK
jgi:Zn-dependent oligopeptidase